MATDPTRGHAALRRGRFSQPQAEYFLTICTEARQPGISSSRVASAILAEMHAMVADGTWMARTAVVMPDHLHLLIILGERLSLSKAMQRLKAKTSAVLDLAGASWERGFFDRQLRQDDSELSIFLYIYLNPYRAGLLASTEKWPYYYCREEDWAWFKAMLHVERPLPEWLM